MISGFRALATPWADQHIEIGEEHCEVGSRDIRQDPLDQKKSPVLRHGLMTVSQYHDRPLIVPIVNHSGQNAGIAALRNGLKEAAPYYLAAIGNADGFQNGFRPATTCGKSKRMPRSDGWVLRIVAKNCP